MNPLLYSNILIPGIHMNRSTLFIYVNHFRVCPGILTYQISGFCSMNFSIRSWQTVLFILMTSTPCCFKYSSPPKKVLFSPITTREMPYNRHAPVHIEQLLKRCQPVVLYLVTCYYTHGDKVVYIVAPLYAEAGSRPEFSKAAVSP